LPLDVIDCKGRLIERRGFFRWIAVRFSSGRSPLSYLQIPAHALRPPQQKSADIAFRKENRWFVLRLTLALLLPIARLPLERG